VPTSVLQPVRRRRRRRPPLLPLAILALTAVVAVFFVLRHRDGDSNEPPAQHTTAAKTQVNPTPPVRRRVAARDPGVLSHQRFDPPLGARAAIVVDDASGRVIWAAHRNRRLPIASTTKIMTAHLVLERLALNKVITIDKGVTRVPLVKEGLRPGERVAVWKLLDGLLLFSGNDDAYALSIAAAGSRANFVRLMNQEARRLGLRHTHFRSPSGVIDKDNYSSAADLATITRAAMTDPRFRVIVRQRLARVTWRAPTFSKIYVNKNQLLGRYRGANGVKTGWTTKAGHCLVASATRDGRTLIAVVLGSTRPYNDAARLLNLGFRVTS
jgi:serine-type D-Ala-D-Ala carboxypeptidase (penicillin-binding protein 5/6)